MVMVRNQLFERAAQPLARRLDLVEKAVFEYDVEHRLSGGARERVAAIGRSVGADDHAPRRLFGGETGAHGETAADALGARHDVGGDAEMLIGIQMDGACDTAQDLVDRKSTSLNTSHKCAYRKPSSALK